MELKTNETEEEKELIDMIVECQRKLINLENKVNVQNRRIRKLQDVMVKNNWS